MNTCIGGERGTRGRRIEKENGINFIYKYKDQNSKEFLSKHFNYQFKYKTSFFVNHPFLFEDDHSFFVFAMIKNKILTYLLVIETSVLGHS